MARGESREPHETSNRPGRQPGSLSIQIAISGALDWACGGDSTVTNPADQQDHFAASYYLSELDRSTEMIRPRKRIHCKLPVDLAWQITSRIVIPFSVNYHAPDSVDWCSSSCPSLVDPRPA